MNDRTVIARVKLRNYKSVGSCDVALQPITYLVGSNGAGKSNFLDAMHFVKDALESSLDHALSERFGLSEVRRHASGHPNHFGIHLGFRLPDGTPGHYAFLVGSRSDGAFQVDKEECVVDRVGKGPYFRVEKGRLAASSEASFPTVTPDRLALVAVSGLAAFRPVFDVLSSMGFYNLIPRAMKELQKPQDGRILKSTGENVASVIGQLGRTAPDVLKTIEEYLRAVVPAVHGVRRKAIGPMETVEFQQDVLGAANPWHFMAQNMSDGTLRALGVLTALFQNARDGGLVGIEEPETALHPAAGAALRDALLQASTTTQIIVSSHSPELLDDPCIDPDSLLVVHAEGNETKIAPIDQASRQVLREQLFSPGELLRLGQMTPNEEVLNEQAMRQVSLFDADR